MLAAALLLGLIFIRLPLPKRFDQRGRLDLLFLVGFSVWSSGLRDGRCKTFQKLLELGVLIDGSLASIVPPPVAWQLRVRGKFQDGWTDKGAVLMRLGGIVEGELADAVTEGSDKGLVGDVDVGTGRFGGFG